MTLLETTKEAYKPTEPHRYSPAVEHEPGGSHLTLYGFMRYEREVRPWCVLSYGTGTLVLPWLASSSPQRPARPSFGIKVCRDASCPWSVPQDGWPKLGPAGVEDLLAVV